MTCFAPFASAFQFAGFQRPFRSLYIESFGWKAQCPTFLYESVGNGLRGIAKDSDENGKHARVHIAQGDTGIECRDLDAAQALPGNVRQEFFGRG